MIDHHSRNFQGRQQPVEEHGKFFQLRGALKTSLKVILSCGTHRYCFSRSPSHASSYSLVIDASSIFTSAELLFLLPSPFVFSSRATAAKLSRTTASLSWNANKIEFFFTVILSNVGKELEIAQNGAWESNRNRVGKLRSILKLSKSCPISPWKCGFRCPNSWSIPSRFPKSIVPLDFLCFFTENA